MLTAQFQQSQRVQLTRCMICIELADMNCYIYNIRKIDSITSIIDLLLVELAKWPS